jgi:hypothetical protein
MLASFCMLRLLDEGRDKDDEFASCMLWSDCDDGSCSDGDGGESLASSAMIMMVVMVTMVMMAVD